VRNSISRKTVCPDMSEAKRIGLIWRISSQDWIFSIALARGVPRARRSGAVRPSRRGPATGVTGDRSEVHDRAPVRAGPPTIAQKRHSEPGAEKNAGQVHGTDAMPTIRIPKSFASSRLRASPLSSDDVAGEVSRVFSEPVPSSRRMYPLPWPSSYHPR